MTNEETKQAQQKEQAEINKLIRDAANAAKLAKIQGLICDELRRATKKFGSFHNSHEGYAVLLEEVDELWDDIKANNLYKSCDEAIQVAAMAIRYLVDLMPDDLIADDVHRKRQ